MPWPPLRPIPDEVLAGSNAAATRCWIVNLDVGVTGLAPEPGSSPVAVSVRRHRADAADRAGGNDTSTPDKGPLVDRYGRHHTDLRVSVTDRCNLRCAYCIPDDDMSFLPHASLLSFDEIVRVASVAHDLGVTSLRLTGGEPLMRRGVVRLVRRLADLGFDDLSMTTNATMLAPVAVELASAGLTRVNISCDSLRADRFAAIRRRGDLATVLAAMDAAEAAGLGPVKVNVVLRRGVNEDEVLDFAAFARSTGRPVRFIEFMPLDAAGRWSRSSLVTGAEVLDRIGQSWPLVPVGDSGAAPAERFRFADGVGEIGVISSISQPFCGTCNRLRLTADGSVVNCLFSNDENSLREIVRGAGTDDEIARLLRRAVWAKYPGHAINEPSFLRPHRSMSMIGG